MRNPRLSRPLKNSPTGFPLYFTKRQPRIVTADVWAYLKHTAITKLSKETEKQAIAFIDQAFEFFEAAQNPRTSSRPLLYYYSFLNLAKTTLLIQRVNIPPAPHHGLSDPRENVRARLQLEGQRLRFVKAAHDRSQLFPEFVQVLGGEIKRAHEVKVISLLRQIPAIHRTFCTITGETPSFMPVKQFEVRRSGSKVFARMILDRTDMDVTKTLKVLRLRDGFKNLFTEVRSPSKNLHELWFETWDVPGASQPRRPIRKLTRGIQAVGVWSILTGQGYRYYLSTVMPRERFPPLASVYAVMFYLGSITRYKPYDFDRIVSHKFSWLISEFLRTQPIQFLYCLAGHIAGVDVVRPFASVD